MLSWLYNKFNSVRLRIMPTNLDRVITLCEVAVLTHAVVNAVSTYEATTDDRTHVTANTLVIVVS